MDNITIYHNPACGTSRNTLALIRNSGVEPEVIEYLKTPPSKERLLELLNLMGMAHASCCVRKARLTTNSGCRTPNGVTLTWSISCCSTPSSSTAPSS